MSAQQFALPRITLRGSLYAFVLITMLIVGVGAALFFKSRSEAILNQNLDQAVRVRTTSAAQNMARSLFADWQALGFLAQAASGRDREAIRDLMNGVRGNGSRISWIGYANTDGEVIEAADGMLVGQDVSARPWFIAGLEGGYAGSVHEAVLLANLLRNESGVPPQFIDLAQPVKNEVGDTIGVVAMHIDAGWMARLLKETADDLRMGLLLFDASGKLILSSTQIEGSVGEHLQSAVQMGTADASQEVWGDGTRYFSSLVPRISYENLPNFGWRLAGRIDAGSVGSTTDYLRSAVLTALAAAVGLLLLATFVYARLFLAPLTALGASAARIAEGSGEYPIEVASTREGAQIAAAVARLQNGPGQRS